MYAYLKGILVRREPTMVILDVNGVGFQLNISLTTYQALPRLHETAQLLTYFHVREDHQSLYGFATNEERDLFLMLINISGIGPRMAINVTSGSSPEQFRSRIIAGDVQALTQIPGIGLKTAKRIIIELREKFVGQDEIIPESTIGETGIPFSEPALKALISLGYRRSEALLALKKAQKELGEGATLEQYIKLALNKM
jgi:Holliday junction DNA helicase RuvA